MRTPDLLNKALILTSALAIAMSGCKKDAPEEQTSGTKIQRAGESTREKLKEADIKVEVAPPLAEPEPKPEPVLPKPSEETRDFEFPSGQTLPIVEWGEPENYEGCEELSFVKDWNEIVRDCYFYNPRQEDVPLVRVEGNETVQLSAHFQAWEFAKIDPQDIAAGNVDPRFYYEYEAPDPLNPGQTRTLFLYKVARINPELVELLEEVRKSYGFSICPDETYRSYVHNRKTRASAKSLHVSGTAMDINLDRTRDLLRAKCGRATRGACSLTSKRSIRDHIAGKAEKIMKRKGGGGIGKYPNILHLDPKKKRSGDGMRRWNSY
jgi:hypothetical protein